MPALSPSIHGRMADAHDKQISEAHKGCSLLKPHVAVEEAAYIPESSML